MMAKKKIESKTKKAAAAILGFPKIFAKREAFAKQKIAAPRPLKTIICAALLALSCASLFAQEQVIVGAARFDKYKKFLKNKRVALAANATSIIPNADINAEGGAVHDLDFLLFKKINVVKVFAPEHGFRGKGEAGETIANDVDQKTGVPIYSIYGKSLRPSPELLADVDVFVYDIQDVGARFYTYISAMHYIMEACAQNDIPLVIFDRPNPNIDCVAGPIRDERYKSYVSLDPIPAIYGMTAGELARMINGQGWLEGGAKCKLTVIPVKNYTRKTRYVLPVPPSPNLPSHRAVRFYPFLCLFEATVVSEGRGTEQPFSAIGYPDESFGQYVFTPRDIPGMATNPKHEGKPCYGLDLTGEPLYVEAANAAAGSSSQEHNSGAGSLGLAKPDGIFTLRHFIAFAKKFGGAKNMVDQKASLARLWGNDKLVEQIDGGMTEEEIRETWLPDVEKFLRDRKPYLLYK
ncbi:MAG: DUF1343 domain-containing protein [Treponema sp.]|nr:DUF1343 domain-containing protein [Treponema sp.]MEE3436150.1 DUF1343 domain-containing protein [Treponema sp.]